MSIAAAQMQLRRRWLSMMMQHRGSAAATTHSTIFAHSRSPCSPVPRCFATATPNILADTHLLGNEEIKHNKIEETKRPPGKGPGEFLHQRKHFPKELFTSKEMVPLYPLLFMVFVALMLGITTMYRGLAEHPLLILKKKKRREQPLPELDEKVGVTIVEKARQYYDRSPFRRMAFGENVPDWIKSMNAKFFHQPPRLPGDDKPEIDPAEPYTHRSPADYMP
ncbi:hypothetical protein L7F22_004451 [Adiantum nelumboides]|nr:hypothetical protein [Adiantum nelumboides]